MFKQLPNPRPAPAPGWDKHMTRALKWVCYLGVAAIVISAIVLAITAAAVVLLVGAIVLAALVVTGIGIYIMFKLNDRHHQKLAERAAGSETQIVVRSARVVDQ